MTLYKSLIRPTLEYPCTSLRKIGYGNKIKLQRIQNKCLRFIKNITLKDRVKIKDMHESLKIEPLNVRIDKLCNKVYNKIKEIYYIPKTQNRNTFYKYSDFTLENEPIRKRRKSVAQQVEKHIINPNKGYNPIKTEKPRDQWKPPKPIYTTSYYRNNNNLNNDNENVNDINDNNDNNNIN